MEGAARSRFMGVATAAAVVALEQQGLGLTAEEIGLTEIGRLRGLLTEIWNGAFRPYN